MKIFRYVCVFISGSGKFTTLMWAGDQNVDFSYADGLPSTIPAALNMGLSGIGITHFDIGGYTTAAQFQAFGQALIRSAELLMRSAEAAIFTPMFRSHEGIPVSTLSYGNSFFLNIIIRIFFNYFLK